MSLGNRAKGYKSCVLLNQIVVEACLPRLIIGFSEQ